MKGVHFEGLRVLGKLERFAHHYYENGADELIFMDAVASLYGRNSLLAIIERAARQIFIPLTVGGGLRTLNDIRNVLRAGADKVAINTAAVKRPEFIREAAESFGSSTILVSIEAMRKPDGGYEAYIEYGREKTNVDALEWATRAAELGAGEIMVTSINREGTGTGFDLELTTKVVESVSIPVIAGGGAGTLDHIFQIVEQGRADAVCVASLLHYKAFREFELKEQDFAGEGNIDFISRHSAHYRMEGASILQIKNYLLNRAIDCRPYHNQAGDN